MATTSVSVWRDRFVSGAVALSAGGMILLFVSGDSRTRAALVKLSIAHFAAYASIIFHFRRTLNWRLLTANAAVGAIAHIGAATATFLGIRYDLAGKLFSLAGLSPSDLSTFQSQGGDVLLVTLVGCFSAWFAWSHAVRDLPHQTGLHDKAASVASKISAADRSRMVQLESTAIHSSSIEPAPTNTFPSPNYSQLAAGLAESDDLNRLLHLKSLQRIESIALASTEGDSPILRTVRQEITRVAASSKSEQAEVAKNDFLSKAAEIAEWASEKGLEELAQMDASDLIMAHCVAQINANATRVDTGVFIPAKNLFPIHAINRDTANQKCNERRDAIIASLEKVKANGNKLSEDLIAGEPLLSKMRSVTGFQVVQMTDVSDPMARKFVTFEGNGRCVGINRAKVSSDILVEVRVYHFKDLTTLQNMRKLIRMTQKSKGVTVVE